MKTYTFLFLIFTSLSSFSQSLFEKNLTGGNSTNTISSIYQLSDQSYIALDDDYYTGSQAVFCEPENFSSFVHLDSLGNTISGMQHIGVISRDEIFYMEFDSGHSHVEKFDANGNLISRSLLNDSVEYFLQKPAADHSIITLSEEIYYGSSSAHTTYFSLHKIDTTGNLTFSKFLSADSAVIYQYSVYPTVDSGFYLIKDQMGYDASVWQVLYRTAIKYNSQLDSISSLALCPECHIYQAGNLDLYLYKDYPSDLKNITKLDANNNIIAYRSFNDQLVWNNPLPLNNGDWVFFNYNNYDVSLAREDTNVNLLWSRSLLPIDTSHFKPQTVIQSDEGGFVIGGYHDGYNGPLAHCYPLYTTSVIMKTDSMGNSLSIPTGLNEKNNFDTSISIYPNPFSFSTSIDKETINGNGSLIFELFNVFGCTIKTLKLSDTKTQLNRDDLSGGIYFYRILDTTGIIKTGKLVIE